MIEYVNFGTYYQDMKTIDDRLTNLEHILDSLTKDVVEILTIYKEIKKEETECGKG